MSMLLDLSRLRSGVDRISRRFEASEFVRADGDLRVSAPVELDVEIRKDAKKVRLVGQVRASLTADCSRCLDPFEVPVANEFDALYLPPTEHAGGPDDEVNVEDLGVSFYQNDAIDLGQLIREQFYLALPMKPLCQPDCKGLCPVCGVNRNRESCDHKQEWVDPRFDALRRLSDEHNRQ